MCIYTARSYCGIVLMEACEDTSKPLLMEKGCLQRNKSFTLLGSQQTALSQDVNLDLGWCSDHLLRERMCRELYILQEGVSAPV